MEITELKKMFLILTNGKGVGNKEISAKEYFKIEKIFNSYFSIEDAYHLIYDDYDIEKIWANPTIENEEITKWFSYAMKY
jgi:hypothetical protein